MLSRNLLLFTGLLLFCQRASASPKVDVPPGTLHIALQAIVEAANVLNDAALVVTETTGPWTTESRDKLVEKLNQIVNKIGTMIIDGIQKTLQAETYPPNKIIYHLVLHVINLYKSDVQAAIDKLKAATTPSEIQQVVKEEVEPVIYVPR